LGVQGGRDQAQRQQSPTLLDARGVHRKNLRQFVNPLILMKPRKTIC